MRKNVVYNMYVAKSIICFLIKESKMSKGMDMAKISESDKKIRMIIGGFLVLGVALGLNKLFFVIIGGALIASGFTGLCPLIKFLDKK